jgi:hypothetical protein
MVIRVHEEVIHVGVNVVRVSKHIIRGTILVCIRSIVNTRSIIMVYLKCINQYPPNTIIILDRSIIKSTNKTYLFVIECPLLQ